MTEKIIKIDCKINKHHKIISAQEYKENILNKINNNDFI